MRVHLDHKLRLIYACAAFKRQYSTVDDGHMPVTNTGAKELIEAMFRSNPSVMWFLHDSLYRRTWPEQCRIIALAVGPTKHFHPLAAWAWMAYDGWIAYIQKHKQSPVDLVAYINAHIEADDLSKVHLKEF